MSIHHDEALFVELRERQQTTQGCAQLRERVAVEHTLAHVGQWQGRRARYRSPRKNLFDVRRCAVVHNLHVLARSQLLPFGCQDAAKCLPHGPVFGDAMAHIAVIKLKRCIYFDAEDLLSSLHHCRVSAFPSKEKEE